jgi:hypothetical protein
MNEKVFFGATLPKLKYLQPAPTVQEPTRGWVKMLVPLETQSEAKGIMVEAGYVESPTRWGVLRFERRL